MEHLTTDRSDQNVATSEGHAGRDPGIYSGREITSGLRGDLLDPIVVDIMRSATRPAEIA